MSIKGIDSQIMIARLPDNVRDTHALVKRPEVAQEYLAARQKVLEAQEQTKVIKSHESEMEQIRTDVDKESEGKQGEGEGGHKSKRDGEEDSPNMLVPPGNHVIDMIV